MPLKWKTTKVEVPYETLEVRHWARHDPSEIIKAVNRGIYTSSHYPHVYRAELGRHKLAIRHFTREANVAHMHPHDLFTVLCELADRHVAIVEMPVAIIHRPHGPRDTIVSLWKGRTAPFHHFLCDDAVSFKRKRQACVKIVRELAKLHANGFVHGHVKSDNFVVDQADNPKFVDYTLIRRATPQETRDELALPYSGAKKDIFTHLSNQLHRRATFSTAPEDNAVSHHRFIDTLKAEYEKQFSHYASIRTAKQPSTRRLAKLLAKVRKM